MIEFDGYLKGTAEKYFYKKAVKYARNALLFGSLMLLPAIIIISIKVQMLSAIILYCVAIVIFVAMIQIKTPKERRKSTPKKICIKDKAIVCIADKYTERKSISLVKNVYDYGDFYYLSFPFGNLSEKYICQKNLITKGTLDDFENLFDGKIIRINEGDPKHSKYYKL